MYKTCCFTGHRKIAKEDIVIIPEILDKLIDKLVGMGVRSFRAGGAPGFDTLAALAVLRKKKKYPELSLILDLPCRNHCIGWGGEDKSIYNYVLSQADEINYAEPTYTQGCIMKRNRMLVDNADICIAYCTRDSGGTAYTLDYAKKNGLTTKQLYYQIP